MLKPSRPLNTKIDLWGIKDVLEIKSWLEEGTLTVERIQQSRNAEERAFLLQIYGMAEYLRDSNAEVVFEPQGPDDYQDGKIYRIPLDSENDMFQLMVINKTVEKGYVNKSKEERLKAGLTEDGYKIYAIECPNPFEQSWRVPVFDENRIPKLDDHGYVVTKLIKPNNMLDAVGATFGFHPGEYRPLFES